MYEQVTIDKSFESPIYAILCTENSSVFADMKEKKMTYVITEDCIQCGACEPECAEGAISEVNGLYVIDASLCQDCGSCADVCPTNAAIPA